MAQMTRAEERKVIREAGAELALLSRQWRDDLLKRKHVGKFNDPIVQARNDALELKRTIVEQRDGKVPEA